MKVFLSVVFPDECNWEKVVEIVDRYEDAHCFDFSHAIYFTGDFETSEILLRALSNLNFRMQVMRNVE